MYNLAWQEELLPGQASLLKVTSFAWETCRNKMTLLNLWTHSGKFFKKKSPLIYFDILHSFSLNLIVLKHAKLWFMLSCIVKWFLHNRLEGPPFRQSVQPWYSGPERNHPKDFSNDCLSSLESYYDHRLFARLCLEWHSLLKSCP